MTKDQQVSILVEFTETETNIRCSKCHYIGAEYQSDDYDAAERFYKKGWRVGRQNCYCPKCAKKHLKHKK